MCLVHSRCNELGLGLPLPQLSVEDFGAEAVCSAPQHPIPSWEEPAESTSPQSQKASRATETGTTAGDHVLKASEHHRLLRSSF